MALGLAACGATEPVTSLADAPTGKALSAAKKCEAGLISWLRALLFGLKFVKAGSRIAKGCRLIKLTAAEGDEILKVVSYDIRTQLSKDFVGAYLSGAKRASIKRIKTIGSKITYRVSKDGANIGITVVNDGKGGFRVFTYGSKKPVIFKGLVAVDTSWKVGDEANLAAVWTAIEKSPATFDLIELTERIEDKQPLSDKIGVLCGEIIELIAPIPLELDPALKADLRFLKAIEWAIPAAKEVILETDPNFDPTQIDTLAQWLAEAWISDAGQTIEAVTEDPKHLEKKTTTDDN
ncbi:MAG: hypothetical protein H6707_12440 [Deltaproteobacteria bacterium]|nr:hypothetical protein [Deltaproteobacteria bacterium]